jgi:hypothetical protein
MQHIKIFNNERQKLSRILQEKRFSSSSSTTIGAMA